MGGLRVRWLGLARVGGAALAALLALQVLPTLLKPPAPPPLAADIGLPRVAAGRTAAAALKAPTKAHIAAAKVRVAPAKALAPKNRRAVRRAHAQVRPSPKARRGPAPASPPPHATFTPPPTSPMPAPVAPSPPSAPPPPPAPSPPPPPGDGSVEFAPH